MSGLWKSFSSVEPDSTAGLGRGSRRADSAQWASWASASLGEVEVSEPVDSLADAGHERDGNKRNEARGNGQAAAQPGRLGEVGMGGHDPVPLFWQAANCDEHPVNIEERNEKEADRFAGGNTGITRLNQAPSPVEIDEQEGHRP